MSVYAPKLTRADIERILAEAIAATVPGEWHSMLQREMVSVATQLLAADDALAKGIAHMEELEDAWARGVISEHDGKGGTRSNRNVEVLAAARAARLEP